VKTASLLKLVFYVAIPLVILGFFISPLRSRVCISEFRLSNDQQQIDAALEDYMKYLRHGEFQDPVPPRKITRKIQPAFTTVDDFKTRFPNCCRILPFSNSDYFPPTWYEWLTGKVGSHVSVEFSVPYLGDRGEPLELAHRQAIPVSTCGSIKTDRFRTPIGGL
jgi:hypothetical protein